MTCNHREAVTASYHDVTVLLAIIDSVFHSQWRGKQRIELQNWQQKQHRMSQCVAHRQSAMQQPTSIMSMCCKAVKGCIEIQMAQLHPVDQGSGWPSRHSFDPWLAQGLG